MVCINIYIYIYIHEINFKTLFVQAFDFVFIKIYNVLQYISQYISQYLSLNDFYLYMKVLQSSISFKQKNNYEVSCD